MNDNININDSHLNPSMTFRRLCFLHMQQLTNFPYIEKDFDALTDYELLCLVVKYLNDVINNSNHQNESITNLYNAFIELQDYMNESVQELEDAFNELNDYVRDYFANLDVQDEINNKLDEMLEDGVLEQIIEQFINSTALWVYDTVADMKAATNLIDGSFAKTLGYYSVNDGGEAIYRITNTESLTDYQEELTSGLYATLILKDYVTPEMYGCHGNGTNDDTINMQKCLTDAEEHHKKVIAINTYLITDKLDFNGTIEGHNTGLFKTDNTSRFQGAILTSDSELYVENLNFDCKSNIEFTLDDKFTKYNNAINAQGILIVENCNFTNLYNRFIEFSGNDTSLVKIVNNQFDSNNKTNIYYASCISFGSINNEECIIEIKNNNLNGFEFEYLDTIYNDYNCNAAGIVMSNLNVKNIDISNNIFNHLGRYGSTSDNAGLSRLCVIDCYYNVKPIKITNNKLINCHWIPVRFHGTPNAIFDKNYVSVARNCLESLMVISDSYNSSGESPVGCDNVTISNNIFENYLYNYTKGITVNSFSSQSIAGESGFYGSVDNLNIVNNVFNFKAGTMLFFDYSLKNLFFKNNTIHVPVYENHSINVIRASTEAIMKTATNGKDFSNTNLFISNNNSVTNGSFFSVRTTDEVLLPYFNQLHAFIFNNTIENLLNNYCIYGNTDDNVLLAKNLMKGYSGVYELNKAYDNTLFRKAAGGGYYNITTSTNNTDYTY